MDVTGEFSLDTILRLENLQMTFPQAQVIDGLSFSLKKGKTLALLGESGCGKSMTALSILQLLPPTARLDANSHIFYHDQDLLNLSEVAMRKIRGRRIAMIFQEPMTSLNPVFTIGEQIGEVLKCHFGTAGAARQQKILQLLEQVGIPDCDRMIHEYPHQLSGGMKQRVMIAMALAGEPEVLIADEPTTALDVTIQAQVLELLRDIQTQTGMAILLITHDLGVVKAVADEVAVMYAGQLVEQASSGAFFKEPRHPYSQKLFDSLPSFEKRQQQLQVIKGFVPKLSETLPACHFANRCPYAWSTCHEIAPKWLTVQGVQLRCHLYDKTIQQAAPTVEAKDSVPVTVGEHLADSKPFQPLLTVKQLNVHFPIQKGLLKRTVAYVKAVDGISFSLMQGETLAIVGESGCGKTTTGRAILQLIRPTAGSIHYQKLDLMHLSAKTLRILRRDIQMIFQDPFSSMNPRMMVEDIIAEGMLAHGLGGNAEQRQRRIIELLEAVGLPGESCHRYPHEFSGGQRQRICIARALAVEPKIIICDEPTSALDVSVQAQILNLLKRLQQEFSLSYIFISHNMSVVAYLADRILVMHKGKVVEEGTTRDLLFSPKHSYTRKLLAAVPTVV